MIKSSTNTQKLLNEKVNILRLTQAVSLAFEGSSNVNKILQFSINEICRFMSWPIGHVYVFDNRKGSMAPKGIWYLEDPKRFLNFKKITDKTVFKLGVGLPGRVMESKEPAWIKSIKEDDNFLRRESTLEAGINSGFAVPILVENKVFAILEFFSPKISDLDQDTINTMLFIAIKIAAVIERKLIDREIKRVRKSDLFNFQKRTRDLKEREERFALCLEGAKEGAWDWDILSNKVIFSDQWKKMLGYEPDEIEFNHDKLESMLHPKDRQRTVDALDESIQNHKDFDQEYRMKNKAGKWLWFRAKAMLIVNDKGIPCRMIGATLNIDDQKLAQKALERSKKKAEDFSNAKTNFLANMSHEIRTPMNGIVGMSNLLLHTDLNETQKDYVDLVVKSSANLLQIINNILDISKIEAGKIELENTDFNLQSTTKEVINLMSNFATEKGINLNLHYPLGLPFFVVGDQGRVRQILFNLINNAVKFTEDADIDVIFQMEKKKNGQEYFKISVKDQGIGIPKGKLKTIFHKFDQADIGTTRKFGGTGLGLTICRELAGIMGGSIKVESVEGEGSAFHVLIKFGLSDRFAVAIPGLNSELQNLEKLRLKNIRVLLAEDNSVNQKVMIHMLEKYGCAITPSSNGREATDQYRRHSFDIIFMDCQMPEIDGYEATKIIRRLEKKLDRVAVPIIAVTANALKGDKERCLDVGMDDYIPKPFTRNDLESVLMKWIGIAE
jgi:PAS domain S-box-containing protein